MPLSESLKTKFFNMLLNTDKSTGDVYAELSITRARFVRWFRDASFRTRLDRVLNALQAERNLDLCRAAARAARVLAEGIREGPALSDPCWNACVDLVKLVTGTTKKLPDVTEDPASLLAPGMTMKRANELMREMDEKRAIALTARANASIPG